MKLLFLILLPFLLSAQVNETLNFFPHHIGDLWQYHNPGNEEYFQFVIHSIDTCYVDSVVNIDMERTPGFEIPHKIYLKDTSTVYWKFPWDTVWSPRYKFNVPVNTNWISYPSFPYWMIYKGESTVNIFNAIRTAKEFWLVNDTTTDLPLSIERVASGIGLYRAEGEINITFLIGYIIDGVSNGIIVNVDDQNTTSLKTSLTIANYPNPFNNQTMIKYILPEQSHVSIKIYDFLGRLITTLYEGYREPGEYIEYWQPKNVMSGIYFAVLQTKNRFLTTKLIYLK